MRYLLPLAIVITAFTFEVRAEQPAGLKVGFIGALSGPAQAYGIAARNGLEMALQDIGARDISVVYEDDQFVSSKTVSALNKLTDIDKVHLVICVGSSPCNAIAPIAEARRLPLIAWASDRRTSRGRSFVVRSYPSGEAEGEASAAEALRRGYRKIAVVVSSTDYALSWRLGVNPALPKESVVMNEEVPPEIQDFRPLIMRARAKGADSYLLCLLPGKSALLTKQAAELGGAAGIGGCDFLDNGDESKAAQGALDRAWFVTIPVAEPFRRKYRARYHDESGISGAAVHYDLGVMLHVLMSRPRTGDLIAGLAAVGKIDGAAGPVAVRETGDDRFFDYALITREVSTL